MGAMARCHGLRPKRAAGGTENWRLRTHGYRIVTRGHVVGIAIPEHVGIVSQLHRGDGTRSAKGLGMTTQTATLPGVVSVPEHHVPWKPILIWTAAGMLVLATAISVVEYQRRTTAAKPRFDTLPVTHGPLTAQVTANGTLSALITVQVGSQVSGRIQKLYVDFNSPVKKGQLCAEIDPLLFTAAVEQGNANVLAADGNLARDEANATNAQLLYQRDRVLRDRNLIAQQDLDTAKASAVAAQSQVEADRGALAQARAALHQAQINLNYTHIVSPIDGVVVSRNVDVGQTVAAAFQAPILFLMAQDLRDMQVDTNIAEADVGRLADGMAATFTVDAYPNDVFKGVIRQVRKNPQTLQNVVTYDAVIDVKNNDLKLFPGMTANVTVVYAQRADVVQVPNAAIRFRPPADLIVGQKVPKGSGAEKVVWVLRGINPEPVVIHAGVSDGTTTELLSGDLRPDDRLVTETLIAGKAGGPGSYGRVF
jgi:HlyD family secretion protein